MIAFDKWMKEVNEPPKVGRQLSSVHLSARILLPGSTFGRAGTAVNTQVLILDKLLPGANPGPVTEIDLRNAKDINELFDELETIDVPERPTINPSDAQRINAGRVDLSSRSSVLPTRPQTAPPVAQNTPPVAQNTVAVAQTTPPVAQQPSIQPVQTGQSSQSGQEVAEPKVLAPVAKKHTRNNTDIFVVQIASRVDRGEFELIRDAAKQAGGYYSNYRGDGAIPGFIFSTAPAADRFYKQMNGLAGKEDAGLSSMMDSLGDTSNPFEVPDSPFFQLGDPPPLRLDQPPLNVPRCSRSLINWVRQWVLT